MLFGYCAGRAGSDPPRCRRRERRGDLWFDEPPPRHREAPLHSDETCCAAARPSTRSATARRRSPGTRSTASGRRTKTRARGRSSTAAAASPWPGRRSTTSSASSTPGRWCATCSSTPGSSAGPTARWTRAQRREVADPAAMAARGQGARASAWAPTSAASRRSARTRLMRAASPACATAIVPRASRWTAARWRIRAPILARAAEVMRCLPAPGARGACAWRGRSAAGAGRRGRTATRTAPTSC